MIIILIITIIVIIIIIIIIIFITLFYFGKIIRNKIYYKNQAQLRKAGQQKIIKTNVLSSYILRNSKIAIKNVLNLSK